MLRSFADALSGRFQPSGAAEGAPASIKITPLDERITQGLPSVAAFGLTFAEFAQQRDGFVQAAIRAAGPAKIQGGLMKPRHQSHGPAQMIDCRFGIARGQAQNAEQAQ